MPIRRGALSKSARVPKRLLQGLRESGVSSAMQHDPADCEGCEHLIESGVNCIETGNQACGLLMSGNGHSPCVGAYLAVLRGQRKPPAGCPLRDSVIPVA